MFVDVSASAPPHFLAEALHANNPDALVEEAIDSEFQSLFGKKWYEQVLLPLDARSVGTRPVLTTRPW